MHADDVLRVSGRGPIARVTPICGWTPGDPDVVLSEIICESGDAGICDGIWNGPGPWAVRVSTPSGCWEMRPREQAKLQNRGGRTPCPAEPRPWDSFFKAGFRRQAAHAVEAVRTGRNPGSATLDDATDTMRVTHEVFA